MPIPRLVAAAVAAVTIIAAPTPSSADTLLFRVTGGELRVDFGLQPFQVSSEAEGDAVLVYGSVFAFFDSAFATLVSGPLVNLDVDAVNGLTTYHYGAGTLTLQISGHRDDGFTAAGTAVFVTQPFAFTVCEGCDSHFGGGNAADFEIQLGAGQFDPDLAGLLRIRPLAFGGSIDFGLEDIDGDPSSNLRAGFDHRGFANLEIDAVAIPEPAALLLTLTGSGAWLARRRRARAPSPRYLRAPK
jgi:hypothetical protein